MGDEQAKAGEASQSRLDQKAGDRPERTGGKGSNGGGRGGGGKRQDASPGVQLSKALSYILRHGAAKEGLKVRQDGYISLQSVMARPKVSKIRMEHGGSPSEEDVMQVVDSNDKKRFEVDRDESGSPLIRAVQGHSIAEITSLDHIPLTLSNLSILSSSSDLEAMGGKQETETLPKGVEILHGTSRDAWEKIRTSGGLSRMKRNHIHLAKGRPGSNSVISGMRTTSAIIIHIDIVAALRDGIPFNLASNGAVLTGGKGDTGVLPLQYISLVEESKTGATVWQPS